MAKEMEKLKERILDICYENKLSHLGSYFSSVEIIDEIYSEMKNDDIFILSSGHCAVALYAVIEKYKGIDANELFLKHGGHPHRDEENHLFCSTGSLGMGLLVAIGRAMADPRSTWGMHREETKYDVLIREEWQKRWKN